MPQNPNTPAVTIQTPPTEGGPIPVAENLHTEVSGIVASIALEDEKGQLAALQHDEVPEIPAASLNEQKRKVEKALFGDPNSLVALVDSGEIDVNATDFQDRTPLMLMTAQGKTEIVKELFARGADPNRMIMFQGRIPMSALDAARQTNRKEIEQILLENGAKSGQELEAERLAAEKT